MKSVCLVVVLFAFISKSSSQTRSIIQNPQPNPNFNVNSTNQQVRPPLSVRISRKFKVRISLTSVDFHRMHKPVPSLWISRQAVLPLNTLEMKSVSPSAMLTAIRFDSCKFIHKQSSDFKSGNKLE